jgi:uncharacterized protein (TIGR03086 family)
VDPIEQLTAVLPRLATVVDGITPDQLDRPTACENFDVHGVLAHMIVLGGAFSYWFRGEPAPEISPPDAANGVPAGEFRGTMDALLAAVASPGALDRQITAPVGTMPGDVFARLVAFDGVVHGWDLATATGQPFDVPADVFAAVDEFARGALTPDMRDGDTFKAETVPPAGATPLERLAAFTGRAV